VGGAAKIDACQTTSHVGRVHYKRLSPYPLTAAAYFAVTPAQNAGPAPAMPSNASYQIKVLALDVKRRPNSVAPQ
jgi:hypothetical protein